MIIKTIQDQIHQAFNAEKLPPTISDGCSREICQEIETRFHGVPRERLNPDDIYFLSTHLILINTDAFRYYLPTILERALRDRTQLDFDALIQNLFWYPGFSDYQNYQKKRLDQFTLAQAQAILALFQYWIQDSEIELNWKESMTLSIPYWMKTQ